MTCGHCVGVVTAEINALESVSEVAINPVPEGDSTVTVVSSGPLDTEAVRAAVARAGYELADAD